MNSDSLVAYLSSKLGYHLSSIMKFHLSFFYKEALPIEQLLVRSTGTWYPNPGPDRVC